MVPPWLHVISIASLVLAAGCSLAILVDEFRHPQSMWIMNVVWPVTALFGSAAWMWGYFRVGRLGTRELAVEAERHGRPPPSQRKPFAWTVSEGM